MAQRLPSYTVTLLADEYDSFARSAPDDDSFPASYDDWLENRTKEDVIAAMRARLGADAEAEFETALAEIERIALIRLKDRLP